MAKLTIRHRYGVTPNELLKDPKISYKAKGLYAQIQSKPEDWDFSTERLALEGVEGRDGIRSGLHELEASGYLERVKTKDASGHFQIEYILHESSTLTRVDNPPTDLQSGAETAYKKEINTKKDIQISSTISKEIQKTPKEEAEEFFATDTETLLNNLQIEGVMREGVRKEIESFKDWWTEPTASGSKVLWQTKPTFEVRRRLARWFRNKKDLGLQRSFSVGSRVGKTINTFGSGQ